MSFFIYLYVSFGHLRIEYLVVVQIIYLCLLRARGISATIVMPDDAPEVKVNAVRGYGAKIIQVRVLFAFFDMSSVKSLL